jgi:hypothetical protein
MCRASGEPDRSGREPRGDRIVVLPLLNARRSHLILTDENREKPEKASC